MKKPLKLKRPEGVKNWYRSGRWHKVYPGPGRTQFQIGDLCQFKPDLLDVKVVQVWRTVDKGIHLYTVCVESSGHEFSTYGSDLLLLERDKPEFHLWKPVFKMPEKPVFSLKSRKPFRLVPIRIVWPSQREEKPIKPPKPAKETIARLWYLNQWGVIKEPYQAPGWFHQDFKNEKELEIFFWEKVEERRVRRYKYGVEHHKYGTFDDGKPRPYPINTDRRDHPEWVVIEWFNIDWIHPLVWEMHVGRSEPEYWYYHNQQKERRKNHVQDRSSLSHQGKDLPGGSPAGNGGTAGKVRPRKGQSKQRIPIQGPGNAGRYRNSQKKGMAVNATGARTSLERRLGNHDSGDRPGTGRQPQKRTGKHRNLPGRSAVGRRTQKKGTRRES